ncbi:MAG: tRNA pseudouridine(55) synthase TruB [Rhodanobacteraceae bacterium]
MPRTEERDLHGILLFDKPAGFSSNRALQTVREMFGAAKAGHTGSLDPLATGLLPICFGEATKIAGLLLGSRKAYETECVLGATTDTEDSQGTVLIERPIPELDESTINAALAKLTGRITQIPPAYSAIKRGGERLYKRARRGEIVTAPPRQVEVQRFELREAGRERLRLYVECGSGTYVRSLVRDLGEMLGCGAHVGALRRLWVEPFVSPKMHTLPELESIAAGGGHEALDALLLPLEAGLAAFPQLRVPEPDATRLRHGQAVYVAGAAAGRYIALDEQGAAVALVECGGDGSVRSQRGFTAPARDPD